MTRRRGQGGGLDEEDVAARTGDGQAGGHTGDGSALGGLEEEPGPAQVSAHVLYSHAHRRGRLPGGKQSGDLAEHLAQLPFQVADPGFAGVVGRDRPQGGVAHAHFARLQPVALQLASEQVVLGDGHLLVFGVAIKADHLQAVDEGAGDGLDHVGGGDEQHLRQIEVHLQVVVPEGVVLSRVEHL